MASTQELKRYRRNLADELDSAVVYDTLSAAEKDATRRAIFAELAAAAFTAAARRLPGVSLA